MADFAAVFELNAIDGTDGSQIDGEAAGNYAGQSVSNAGDINGDGIDDFLIGATGVGGASQGAVYVVFGTASGFGATFSLSSINGTNGFQINGGEYAQDFAGVSVAAAGDVNNDGIDDLIIGASGADPDGGGSGAAYVLFGKNTAVDGAFASDIATSSLTGTTGFQISGTNGGDGLGFSVSSGDFNGDGVVDLLVGANQADGYRGAAYVIFGGTGVGASGNIDVATLNGANGFKMPAVNSYDYAGTSVANAGDVNGDGIDDIIIGAMGSDAGGTNSGAAYIIFGRNTAVDGNFASTMTLSGLDGTNGFRLAGLAIGDQLGVSVSGAGDVNGDGIDDFIVGANGLTNNGGAFVVFGKNTSVSGNFAASINVSALDGTNGFRVDGEVSGDNLGVRVSAAGDVNGDGIADVLIGANGQDPHGNSSGAAYVIYGRNTGFGATVSLSGLDGTNGFKINGEAAGDSISRVSAAGDVNHDGADDILVASAFQDAAGNNAGATYIIYGHASAPTATAPTVSGDGTETLAATNEDVNNSSLANTVSTLFSGQFSDSTDTFAGIAVTANGSSVSTGQWQYWNGASWVNIGTSSTASATVITAATPLRFSPAGNFNGAAPTLTVHLIDSSAGALTNGSHVDLTTSGGTTPYSSGTVVLDHSVTAVNDAPTVINGTTTTLTAVNEDVANPAGATVSSLFGSHFSDAADDVVGGSSANSFAGIMIGIDNSNASQGHWQVFSGGSWFDLPALSPTNTYLISASDSLRFVPAANYNGTPGGIVVLLIDDSAGAVTTGTRLDSSLTGSGGSTVYSNSTMNLGTSITAVNDAPDVNADTTATFTEGQGAIAVTPNYNVTDVDSANLTGATITIADLRAGDVLGFTNQNGITGSYNPGTGVLTLSGTASVANYQAAIRSITYDGAADANFGGTDNSRTVNITVTDGTDPSSQTATVVSIDDGAGAVANDDAVSTNENAVLNGNVESNNGNGADTGVTTVTEVNGVAGNVGTQITLAGGGLLTVNADGTFSFDPNGKYDYLAGPASGASNTSATETFTYTVDGGDTATVTITINGVDSSKDVLQGTGGGDTINGGTGNDTINGLGGDDNLSGGTGNDIVNGGDNNDTLNGDDGNDKLNGDNGTDTLNGGLGADLLHGGAGDDHLFGGADNDTLYGDGGNDDMHGGAGNDVYYVDDAGDTVDEQPGEGTDVVRASISYTLGGDVENLELQGSGDLNGTGNSGNNRIEGASGANLLQGMDGNDTLNGYAGKDNLQGGNGNDIINGGDDNDTIDGGADTDNLHGDNGNDIVHGGAGTDFVYGDEGNDKVYGDDGNDNLYGGNGADYLYGGADNDHLYGGDANDTLDGGTGVDYMEGGVGNDVYLVDNIADQAVENAGEGYDIVRASVNYTLGDNIEALEQQGTDSISGTGNALNNSLTGNSGANLLKGLAGNDTLIGGDGNDTLIGGSGNDQMTGGNGYDTFVIQQDSLGGPSIETDFVYDLNMAGGDRIDLSAIDADSTTAGNQAFHFVSSFGHHAAEATLTYDAGAGLTTLKLDVNGDGIADYQMRITGDVTATSTNVNTGSELPGDGGWIL